MTDWWARQFFLYCERGSDPAFWAEPFNAVSNGAFLFAAAAAFAALTANRSDRARPERLLILLSAIIGVASFAFHTTAARWAIVLDTASIAVMSFAYLAFAMRRLLSATWAVTVIGLAALALGLAGARALPCPAGLLPITAAAGHPCLNGSMGYLPVVAAMAAMAAALSARGHEAAGLIAGAALVFALSLVLRTFDTELCGSTHLFGRARGTHALWHVLNAAAIYLLLIAAIRHGAAPVRPPQ